MASPYDTMGVKFEDSDEEIRARYLDLVRQFPPEHHAARFNAIRAAYEQIRTLPLRVEHLIMAEGRGDTVEEVIREVFAKMPRKRITLSALVEAHQKANQ